MSSSHPPLDPAEVAERTLQALQTHMRRVLDNRLNRKPTCYDQERTVAENLSAIGEEFGEVCQALQDQESLEHLRSELLDLATGAALWAEAIRVHQLEQ